MQPKPEAPEWLGLSPVIWLVLGGGVVLGAVRARGRRRRLERGEGALLDPQLLRNVQLRSGVLSFLFMFLVQAGTFFVVPLFLSVALGLSAIETGVRLLPLSLTLLLFAVGRPEARAARQPAAGRQRRLPAAVRRARAARRAARRRRRAGDHHLAAAAGRLRARRDGLAAGQRHRLGGARRAERRGRRPAEHRHPARRVDRHRARGRDPHLGADRVVLHRHPEQPRRPRHARRDGADRARGRRAVRLRRRPARRRSTTPASRRTRQRRRGRERGGRIDGLRSALAVLALIALLALLFTRGLPTVQPGSEPRPGAPPGAA